jgi:hypothetical protein
VPLERDRYRAVDGYGVGGVHGNRGLVIHMVRPVDHVLVVDVVVDGNRAGDPNRDGDIHSRSGKVTSERHFEGVISECI